VALAAAVLIIGYVEEAEAIREARAEGVLLWVEPGFIPWAFLLTGLICFLGFVISLLVDLRRAKSGRR